jgi:hypothetical protein
MRTTTTSTSNNHGVTTRTNLPRRASTPTSLTTLRPTPLKLDFTGSLRAITTTRERRKEQMKAGARDISASRVPGTVFFFFAFFLTILKHSSCHRPTTTQPLQQQQPGSQGSSSRRGCVTAVTSPWKVPRLPRIHKRKPRAKSGK